jgi:phosphoglycolate phosphatase
MSRPLPSRVTLAVFDLDGTLVDSLPDLADTARQLLSSYGLAEPEDAAVRAMIGDGVRVLAERLIAWAKAPPSVTADEATARFVALYTPRATRFTRPFPGTIETLERLTASGIACAVCTNKPEAPAREILQNLGLAPFIGTLAGGDAFPYRKPDPRHLLATLARAGTAAENAVMIGDHANDIRAACGASVAGIFADWGYGRPDPHVHAAAQAERITEIPILLDIKS